jgi:hypothetical protein
MSWISGVHRREILEEGYTLRIASNMGVVKTASPRKAVCMTRTLNALKAAPADLPG